jgi:hypothetical protein
MAGSVDRSGGIHHFALTRRGVKKLDTQQGIQVSYKAWGTGCPKFRTLLSSEPIQRRARQADEGFRARRSALIMNQGSSNDIDLSQRWL